MRHKWFLLLATALSVLAGVAEAEAQATAPEPDIVEPNSNQQSGEPIEEPTAIQMLPLSQTRIMSHEPRLQYAGRLKLEETLEDGSIKERYCSGTFVAANVIVTAAHCVQAPGLTTNYTLKEFQQHGVGDPFELSNKPGCIHIANQWGSESDPYLRIQHDYAFIKTLDPTMGNPPGLKITNDHKFAPPRIRLLAVGYAGGSDVPIQVEAYLDKDVLHPTSPSFTTSNTAFAQGVSGGPWVRFSGSHQVLSVSSSFIVSRADNSVLTLYGPAFDSVAQSKLNQAIAASCSA